MIKTNLNELICLTLSQKQSESDATVRVYVWVSDPDLHDSVQNIIRKCIQVLSWLYFTAFTEQQYKHKIFTISKKKPQVLFISYVYAQIHY